MSLLVRLGPALSQLRRLWPEGAGPRGVAAALASLTAGVALLAILARRLKRRKRPMQELLLNRSRGGRKSRLSGLKSPGGTTVGSLASGGRRVLSDRPARSVLAGSVSDRASSLASGSLGAGGLVRNHPGGDGEHLTPQQLGLMGMEALETAINYWEDALATYRKRDVDGVVAPVLLGPEETGFCGDLQLLLEEALELQERSELLFLDERSVLFKSGSRHSDSEPDAEMSGAESFASARDMVADLREFDEFSELFPDPQSLALYQSALRQLESGGGIPCRTLRTEMVRCGSDGEYLAKLHCLRLAFQKLLRDPDNYVWFCDAGRQILADLLLYADRDPKDFLVGYEEMLGFVREPHHWRLLEEELRLKGVKALTFFDVVLDYILMDAFEDLESPPSSVTAVVRNRWLSDGFKETALTTAVWSVLKAKRKMLKFPSGFMAHFYAISEQLSPLLAWGFLGPDDSLRDTCVYFKDQVTSFLVDIFDFQKCRFTNVDELAEDVLTNTKIRIDNICRRLSSARG